MVPLFVQAAETESLSDKPNFVVAFADDWGRIASIYDRNNDPIALHQFVKTPRFDEVARAGVLFTHAFVNAPSCTPCRSSLLSGQHFWRTGRGAILVGAQWDETIPSWPLLLNSAGYTIGKSYKVWSPGTPADAPFGGKKFAFEKHGRQVNQFSQNITKRLEKGVTLEDARSELLAETAGNFGDFLKSRPAGKPFCYWYGPTNVHRLWTRGSGKALWGIDPDQLQGHLPGFLPDVPEVREDVADYLGEIQAFDAQVGVLIDRLKQDGLWENTIFIISGDHGPPGFPHGKCNLYDFGTRVPLAICGPGVSRLPATANGKPTGPRVVDDLVSLPDLAPTILELAGVPEPSVMTAHSLVPLLRSEASGLIDPRRDHVLIGRERHVQNARAGMLPYPQRAIRTADHLLVINYHPERTPMGDEQPPAAGGWTFDVLANNTRATFPDMDAGVTKAWIVMNPTSAGNAYRWSFAKRPEVELYDVRKDPHQLVNLAEGAGQDDPAIQATIKQLRTRLEQELIATGDPRLTGSRDTFDKPPFTGEGN
jgi:arylsulfatase A-like enzyme